MSCGGGSQSRDRTCTDPTPGCGPNSCAGDQSETQDCNEQCCPGNISLNFRSGHTAQNQMTQSAAIFCSTISGMPVFNVVRIYLILLFMFHICVYIDVKGMAIYAFLSAFWSSML